MLRSQPHPVRGLAKLEGWTPETIGNHCIPALQPMFTDLGPTASGFKLADATAPHCQAGG
jgi:hypothetical protein